MYREGLVERVSGVREGLSNKSKLIFKHGADQRDGLLLFIGGVDDSEYPKHQEHQPDVVQEEKQGYDRDNDRGRYIDSDR